jgi:hypothetical protein
MTDLAQSIARTRITATQIAASICLALIRETIIAALPFTPFFYCVWRVCLATGQNDNMDRLKWSVIGLAFVLPLTLLLYLIWVVGSLFRSPVTEEE